MSYKGTGEYEVGVIKMFHDDAYAAISAALTMEENQQGKDAISLYENGIRLLEQALSINCNRPEYVGENWDKARFLQMKMRKTREEVLNRLDVVMRLRSDISFCCPSEILTTNEMPPSYDEACDSSVEESPGSSRPTQTQANGKSFDDICQKMGKSCESGGYETHQRIPETGTPIFHISSGVQIFFVSANGEVSAPTYPTALTIYKFKENKTNTLVPPAFLEIGQWTYPLYPGRLPVLHTTFGAYMLPDLNSTTPGAAVGIVLTDVVESEDRHIFEHLICELTVMKAEVAPPSREPSERRMSERLSEGLVTGAEMLSKGMLYGAEKTSEYIKLAANKWRDNMEPAHSPTYVNPNVQRGLQIAKDVSDVAVKVSGYIINQLGRATVALGQQLAPHVRKHSSTLLAKAYGEEEHKKADETLDSVLEVAAGGLKGFSTVYLGLQESAKILANSLISETVTTVNYKYGAEAASSTDDGLRTIGNVAYTTYNVDHLGIKAIAKRAAKDTGKALILENKGETLNGNK